MDEKIEPDTMEPREDAVPQESSVCQNDNTEPINEHQSQEDGSAALTELIVAEPAEPEKKKSKKVIWFLVPVLGVLALAFAVLFIGRARLKKNLTKEWYDVDDSILLVLDISENEIEYRLETEYWWLNTTVDTLDWKPYTWNKIKVRYGSYGDYKVYTIKFNDDKDVMRISPALTSSAYSETWYHID